jgi:hypothetical protein
LIFKFFNPKEQVCSLVANPQATRRILLWGNSHADHWSGLFTELAQESSSAFYLNARNCRATPDHSFCGSHVQKKIFDFISSEHVTDVVLSSTGYGSYQVADDIFESNLKDLVKRLTDIGVRTWLVIDIPTGESLSPIRAYEKNPADPKLGSIPLDKYMETKEREQKLFDSLSHSSGEVRVIDPSLSFCDSENCLGGKDGAVWYRDSGHVTDEGAKAAKKQFLPIFMTDHSTVNLKD